MNLPTILPKRQQVIELMPVAPTQDDRKMLIAIYQDKPKSKDIGLSVIELTCKKVFAMYAQEPSSTLLVEFCKLIKEHFGELPLSEIEEAFRYNAALKLANEQIKVYGKITLPFVGEVLHTYLSKRNGLLLEIKKTSNRLKQPIEKKEVVDHKALNEKAVNELIAKVLDEYQGKNNASNFNKWELRKLNELGLFATFSPQLVESKTELAKKQFIAYVAETDKRKDKKIFECIQRMTEEQFLLQNLLREVFERAHAKGSGVESIEKYLKKLKKKAAG